MQIKLHISPCPNDTFMFDALINGRIDTRGLSFDVEYHDIEELNERVLNGKAEISKISCATLAQISNNYNLCDSGAALGHGNGPLLVRRKGEGASTPIRRVATPGLHTTADALLKLLFPQVEERVPTLFSQIAKSVERGEVDAGVLIHEGRFVYHTHNLELVADLGVMWEEQTKLPLPLGCIVMHKDLPLELQDRFEGVLRASIEYAFKNPMASREFIKSHAQELDDRVIESHISLFVNEFSISLGKQGRDAISRISLV